MNVCLPVVPPAWKIWSLYNTCCWPLLQPLPQLGAFVVFSWCNVMSNWIKLLARTCCLESVVKYACIGAVPSVQCIILWFRICWTPLVCLLDTACGLLVCNICTQSTLCVCRRKKRKKKTWKWGTECTHANLRLQKKGTRINLVLSMNNMLPIVTGAGKMAKWEKNGRYSSHFNWCRSRKKKKMGQRVVVL